MLKWVFSDRQGNLRNTSFGILSSDGKEKLTRSGRSPSMVFDDAATFAETLTTLTEERSDKKKKAIESLPILPDLRMALGVAAADLRPLVVVYETNSKRLATQSKRLSKLAWSEDFVGKLRYVIVDSKKGLEGFEDLKLKPGISLIQAEAYGRGGEILSHASQSKTTEALAKSLEAGREKFDAKSKNVRDHISKGQREDIKWASAIPVSDPGAKGRDRK